VAGTARDRGRPRGQLRRRASSFYPDSVGGSGSGADPCRRWPRTTPETLNAGAPASGRDTHGKRVLSIASAAARLAGLADPEAHAEHVQAASRLGSAAMWPAGIEFRLHPDGACAWKVVMAGCVVNASLGAGEASR